VLTVLLCAGFASRAVFSAEGIDDKKVQNEPAFVLPEVIISGENEALILRNRTDQDAESSAQMVKEAPSFDTDQLHGPAVLSETKPVPVQPETKEGRTNYSELTAGGGIYNHWQINLLRSEQIEQFNYLARFRMDRRDESGNKISGTDFCSDANYRVSDTWKISGTVNWDQQEMHLPYGTVYDTQMFRTFGFSMTGKMNSGRDSASATGYYTRSSLDAGGTGGDLAGANLQTEFNVVFGPEQTIRANVEIRHDSLYSNILLINVEDILRQGKLAFNAGIHQEDIRTNFIARVFWYPDEKTTLKVKFEPELDVPSFAEIYRQETGVRVNPDIRCSWTRINLSADIEHRFGEAFEGNMEFFVRRTENYLAWADTDKDDVWTPENFPDARILGSSFSYRFSILENLSQTLKYEFRQLKSMDDSSLVIPYAPESTLSIGLLFSPGTWDFDFGMDYTGQRYSRPESREKMDAFWLGSFRVSNEILPGLTVFGKIENIFNSPYQVWYRYPRNGTTVFAGIMARI